MRDRQREYSAEAECVRTARSWMTRDGSRRPLALQQVGRTPETLNQLFTHTHNLRSMTLANTFLCDRRMLNSPLIHSRRSCIYSQSQSPFINRQSLIIHFYAACQRLFKRVQTRHKATMNLLLGFFFTSYSRLLWDTFLTNCMGKIPKFLG